MAETEALAAGDFASWLRGARGSLRTGSAADVPCGACSGCCGSSYFIHIGPDEAATLSRIPAELLFEAPGQPKGVLVMGYNEHGCCPMLIDSRCSIYEHRPRTCRVYDCRVFSATGISPPQRPIADQTQRWVFEFPTETDREEYALVRACGAFVRDKADCFPSGTLPSNEAQLAVFAIKSYRAFGVLGSGTGREGDAPGDNETAMAVVEALRHFDSSA
jgi:Fe-S-cluster containining protein